MNSHEGFSGYYEDALKIHAICADLDFSENDARLLTYMHVKGCESGIGIDYFNDPPEQDREALEIMLGKSKGALRLPAVINLNENGHKALDLILNISSKINELDNILASELGMENRLSGELRIRLRLYNDFNFRTRMVSIYTNKIEPQLSVYDKEKVDMAFTKYKEEQVRIEKDIIEMTGFGDK